MSDEPPPSVLERTFLLPEDVLFIPVEELVESVREGLDCTDGDIAVTRPGFRIPSRLVDEQTAALLKQFRPASRLVDAIIRFSAERGLDPERTLDEAFPALQIFSESRILVPEDSPHAAGIVSSWAPGQLVAGLEVVAALQCTHDTEVYRACGPEGRNVALKIEQKNAPAATVDALIREERCLALIGGTLAPELVRAGVHQDRRFLTIDWVQGISVTARAAEIRNGAPDGWRVRLHSLACEVLGRYADLHAVPILHGDVHPRNALVDSAGRVTLIDFGMARQPRAPFPLDHGHRAGFGRYLDPETAALLAEGMPPGPVNSLGEQYAVAAMLYEIFTGDAYLDFLPGADNAYRQIMESEPQPFTRRGFEAWPAVERVLRRALSKLPTERFATTGACLEALRQALPPHPRQVVLSFDSEAREFVDGILDATRSTAAPLEALFTKAPVASNDHGAGGLAWFLYRVAVLRQNPGLLAEADVWGRRAEQAATEGRTDAFYTPASTVDGFEIGACSVLHRASGIHYVRALICHARGDLAGLDEQVRRFVAAAGDAGRVNDVTLGRSGVLLAATALLDALAFATRLSTGRLAAFARDLYGELSGVLEMREPEGLLPLQPYSFAHGRVGLAYALMRAARALHEPLPSAFEAHVDRLMDLVRSLPESPGRMALDHLMEPAVERSGGEWIPGWCNGTAGYIPLFLLAHEVYGRDAYAQTAEWAASNTGAHWDRHGHLCCGLAGRVFALLHVYRYTGRSRWLEQARALGRQLRVAQLPADAADQPFSLLRGRLGCALALEEVQYPEWATMAFFGDLGWPPDDQ